MDALESWLIGQGLEGGSVAVLLGGAAERLVAAGVPVERAYLALPTVNPLVRVTNHIWRAGLGVVDEPIGHDVHPDAFAASPFHAMLAAGSTRELYDIGPGTPPTGFPVVEAVRDEGATAYLAILVGFGARAPSALRGVAMAFSTVRPGGFPDDALARIEAAVPALALAAYRIVLFDVAVGVLDTYVGLDAGRRVLAGEMRRGHGEELTAALLFSDLRGFTAASEARGRDLVPRLSRHLAAMAEPVEAHGGEVLKFMGDGLLAAFPLDPQGGPENACAAALAAARDAIAQNDAVNAAGDGAPLPLDVALHLGTVFYGNIGAAHRLDFTVIGPAVNELARIEALCGVLDEPLLLSADFARHCGAPVRDLGPHVLRGVTTPRRLFTPRD